MPKLKHILIIVAVILTFGIAWKFFKRVKDTEKLKLGDTSLKAAKKLESFKDLAEIGFIFVELALRASVAIQMAN